MRFLLQVAGLVLFTRSPVRPEGRANTPIRTAYVSGTAPEPILAAVFAFGVGTVTLETQLGLAFAGLACWCASSVPAPPASF